jgi:predicted MFS family arabinose efflux permease
MDAVSYNLGRAIAPLISIAIAHWLGFGWAFAGNAISFFFFAMILWRIRQNGAAEPKRESRVGDGFRIARNNGTIMILLLMVAAVTIADDPILVLGPALASRMHVTAGAPGWFIAALGAGSVAGSLLRAKHPASFRLTAWSLAVLGGCMVAFVMTPWWWVSAIAAFGAGIAGLLANSATRTLLSKAAGPQRLASVMAVWAIAWAGSKPIASLTDGLLAGLVGLRWTGIILALPALIPLVVLVSVPGFGRRLARFRREPLERGTGQA